MKYTHSFRPAETALLLALSFSLLLGVWAEGTGRRLSGSLVRLHVVAASDEDAEQAVKLAVRDAVLDYLSPRLEDCAGSGEALELISGELEGVERAAEAAAGGRTVSVSLGEEYYPTREYESFSLPAGVYESLRVVIGPGRGHNWWCVVFPPLCLTSAEAESAFASLDEQTGALITGRDGGAVIKFRVVELWNELLDALGVK